MTPATVPAINAFVAILDASVSEESARTAPVPAATAQRTIVPCTGVPSEENTVMVSGSFAVEATVSR